MTKQDAINVIVNNIVSNNNNEISADVLRPVLVEMVSQINELVGPLSQLETTNKSSIVRAINEVKNITIPESVKTFTGTYDPNQQPAPSDIKLGDYYRRTSQGNTIEYYIWNGSDFFLLDAVESNQSSKLGEIVKIDTGSSLLLPEYANVGIYNGNTSSFNIVLPLAAAYEWREVTYINQYNNTINISAGFIDFNGNRITLLRGGNAITLKSDGTNWIRIR